jgi:tetratricopeptide (TPR) repeat protein
MRLVLSLLLAFAAAPQFQSLIQEGLAALQEKDLATAQTRFEQATALEPESAPAWYLLAQTYAGNDNLTAAFDAAGKAVEFAGSDATILFNVALFYLNAGQPEPSIAAADRALALENSTDVRMLLGRAHAARQDWPNAIVHYQEAQRLSPYSDEVLFKLAQTYLLMQDFPKAIAVLEEGRKTFMGVAQLELALGIAYYGQRRFSDAVDSFLAVMRMAPEVAQPYYFVGKMLEHASDRLPEITEQAINFEKIAPQSPLGYVLHARTIMRQLPPSQYPAEAARAQALLEKALEIKEDQPDAHYLMGTLLERKKDYETAVTHLERSIELDATALEPHFRLAVVYNRLGRKEDAARERALHEKLSEEEGSGSGSPLTPPAAAESRRP